jgi:hypothetical protein
VDPKELIFTNNSYYYNISINFMIIEKTKRYDSQFGGDYFPNSVSNDIYYYSYNNPIFFYDNSGYGPTGRIIGGIIGGGLGLHWGMTLGGIGGAALGGGGGAVSCSSVAPGVGTAACGAGGVIGGGAVGAAVGGVGGLLGGAWLGSECGDEAEDRARRCMFLCQPYASESWQAFMKCFMACLASGGPPVY